MNKMLHQKTALITGASRGIGKAIALAFAKEGAQVAFTYLSNKEKASALEQELKDLGVKAKAYQVDAGNFAQCEAAVETILEDFGGLDICVNNAGISKDNLLLRLTEETWDEVMQANLKSVFNTTKQVIRPLIKRGGGSIINISSIIGLRGNAGQAAYAASKAGIVGFSKSIALEYGSRNIRCNVLAPGFIETDMTAYLQAGGAAEAYLQKIPLGRFGSAADIGDASVFLASDKSKYITGQVLSICGGLHI